MVSRDNDQALIVRLEKYDIKCSGAYIIDEMLEVNDSIQLMKGWKLTIAKLSRDGKVVENQCSIAIDEPTPFKDASEER